MIFNAKFDMLMTEPKRGGRHERQTPGRVGSEEGLEVLTKRASVRAMLARALPLIAAPANAIVLGKRLASAKRLASRAKLSRD